MHSTLQLQSNRLYAALASPSLSVMNFLNEVAMRYPEAISFAFLSGRAGLEPDSVVVQLRAVRGNRRRHRSPGGLGRDTGLGSPWQAKLADPLTSTQS